MNILNLFVAIVFFAFVSCNNMDPEKPAATDPEAAIVLTVAGNTRTISADVREQDIIDFNDYPIKTVFRKKGQDDLQFEINLNLYDTNVRRKVPLTYHELGEDRIRFGFDGNAGEMLNFEELFPVSGSVDVAY